MQWLLRLYWAQPSSEFMPKSIVRDSDRFLVTDASLKAASALFVAGAVRSGHGGMVEHAVTEGLAAADEAIKALDERDEKGATA